MLDQLRLVKSEQDTKVEVFLADQYAGYLEVEAGQLMSSQLSYQVAGQTITENYQAGYFHYRGQTNLQIKTDGAGRLHDVVQSGQTVTSFFHGYQVSQIMGLTTGYQRQLLGFLACLDGPTAPLQVNHRIFGLAEINYYLDDHTYPRKSLCHYHNQDYYKVITSDRGQVEFHYLKSGGYFQVSPARTSPDTSRLIQPQDLYYQRIYLGRVDDQHLTFKPVLTNHQVGKLVAGVDQSFLTYASLVKLGFRAYSQALREILADFY